MFINFYFLSQSKNDKNLLIEELEEEEEDVAAMITKVRSDKDAFK